MKSEQRDNGGGNTTIQLPLRKDGTRSEYWVLTLAGKGKDARLVGVKALAVES